MSVTATVVSVDAGGAQTGSVDLDVPPSCTCVAAVWHHYDSGTTVMSSLSLGGEALTLAQNVGSNGSFLIGGGVGYRNNPLTGTRALAWDWGAGGAREEGGRIYVIFFEGSSGAVSYLDSDWNGADDATNPGPLTLTSATGGAVWAVGQSYGATNPDLSASGGGGLSVTATGIASGESFGSAAITTGAVTVSPSGISSAESFGSAAISTSYTITAFGISSLEDFGSATLTSNYAILPGGIASAEAIGAASLSTGGVSVTPLSVGSAESFGSATLSQGGVFILPDAIASLEAFGVHVFVPGGVFILPDGITSAEAFGVAIATSGAIIAPASIESLEAFGLAGVSPGTVVILPGGIASNEAFGAAQVGDVVIVGNYYIVRGIVSDLIYDVTEDVINDVVR